MDDSLAFQVVAKKPIKYYAAQDFLTKEELEFMSEFDCTNVSCWHDRDTNRMNPYGRLQWFLIGIRKDELGTRFSNDKSAWFADSTHYRRCQETMKKIEERNQWLLATRYNEMGGETAPNSQEHIDLIMSRIQKMWMWLDKKGMP